MERSVFLHRRARGFTLLEVALVVAIIGMMMMMIVGYLMAPKKTGALPPVGAPKLIPGSGAAEPAATPVPSATPSKTIELKPTTMPAFR